MRTSRSSPFFGYPPSRDRPGSTSSRRAPRPVPRPRSAPARASRASARPSRRSRRPASRPRSAGRPRSGAASPVRREGDDADPLGDELAEHQAVPPGRNRVARVEGPAGRRPRVLEAGVQRRPAHLGVRSVPLWPTHVRPAVVSAGLEDAHLVEAVRPVLGDDRRGVGEPRDALRVAVAERVDAVVPAVVARVVLGRAPVAWTRSTFPRATGGPVRPPSSRRRRS